MAPTEGESGWMLGLFNRDYPMVMFGRALKLKRWERGEVSGQLRCLHGAGTRWGFYRYGALMWRKNRGKRSEVSLCNHPRKSAGDRDGLSGAARTTVGKGTVVWSCVPFEKADRFSTVIFLRWADPFPASRRDGVSFPECAGTGGIYAVLHPDGQENRLAW